MEPVEHLFSNSKTISYGHRLGVRPKLPTFAIDYTPPNPESLFFFYSPPPPTTATLSQHPSRPPRARYPSRRRLLSAKSRRPRLPANPAGRLQRRRRLLARGGPPPAGRSRGPRRPRRPPATPPPPASLGRTAACRPKPPSSFNPRFGR